MPWVLADESCRDYYVPDRALPHHVGCIAPSSGEDRILRRQHRAAGSVGMQESPYAQELRSAHLQRP